jgi:hypothetical protein
MDRPTVRAGIVLAALAVLASAVRAEGPARPAPQASPSPQVPSPVLAIPDGLPRYELAARLDLDRKQVRARQRVAFTNRTARPTDQLVFHVYPRYKIPDGDRLVLSKTLEMLRLSPEEGMDPVGRRMEVGSVRVGGAAAGFAYDPGDPTILVVPLPAPVAPGGTAVAELEFTLDLPETWGRWGHRDGITYLVNWYPVLAHHDDNGWQRTPFVPWHQPFYQEAGLYDVTVELPAEQVIASTGSIVRRELVGASGQRVRITSGPARDFALVCSSRFRTYEREAGGVLVRVHGLPEHEQNARHALEYACEVIPLYQKWFGPYPEREFEIAPSFFGWNGNECSGLVLLDDRVMKLPQFGVRYIDHLVTHETCHQWWWNVVGTDGYAETFMDEGLVNCFTALRLDAKYGRNAPLIVWPRGLSWLPSIGREDLRLAGYYGWRARGNGGPITQDLGQMGNLNTLFSLAYDRGGKVVEMIRNRLGEERFFAFFGHLYRTYAYRTIRIADLERELAAFDPGGDWPAFFRGWVHAHEETDWAVDAVRVEAGGAADPLVRRVSVELAQNGAMPEPTVLLARCPEGEIRVPIWPDAGDRYEVPGATVARQDGKRWLVTLQAPGVPEQVEVDPDHALLDAAPDNNRWKREWRARFTPALTPMDLAPQFHAHDRTSIVVGPFVDQYARAGFKAGAQRLDRWDLVGWAGVEPALSEVIFGGQARLLNWPGPYWTAGVFYEEGLYNFHNDERHSGGRVFLRKRLLESSSAILDDPAYYEFYLGNGYVFWAGDDGRPVNRPLTAVGMRFRMSTLFPYWDPVEGRLLEASAEYGPQGIGNQHEYVRVTGEWGRVWSFPEASWPFLARSRFALRTYGGWAWPDTDTYFRLGGGRRLRALDLVTQEGSSVWLTTAEWRFPLWRCIDYDVLDHVLSPRNLYGVAFVDVGQSYFNGEWGPVVYGPGFGLRLDVTLFAFLERMTVRLDLAQPIGLSGSRGPVLWFGFNQVF